MAIEAEALLARMQGAVTEIHDHITTPEGMAAWNRLNDADVAIRAALAQARAQTALKVPTWEEAVTLARRAIYDTDGRGMIARSRNYLHERVAREIFNATRALDKEAADPSPPAEGRAD